VYVGANVAVGAGVIIGVGVGVVAGEGVGVGEGVDAPPPPQPKAHIIDAGIRRSTNTTAVVFILSVAPHRFHVPVATVTAIHIQ